MFDVCGDYTLVTNEGISVVKTLSFPCGCEHGFTARFGGVSDGAYATLNFGWNRPEPQSVIKENYMRLCKSIDVSYDDLVLVSYEHGTNVCAVTSKDRGRGFNNEALPPCDGIVTNSSDVTLVALHADCAGIFVYDPITRCVGLAHAGWRGMIGRIGANLVAAMQREYGASTANMFACIAPAICVDCYEVDTELADRFKAEFGNDAVAKESNAVGKAHIDLQLAGILQMIDAGIDKKRLSVIPCCTYENEELFYSYRRDKGKTGAMASYIRLS